MLVSNGIDHVGHGRAGQAEFKLHCGRSVAAFCSYAKSRRRLPSRAQLSASLRVFRPDRYLGITKPIKTPSRHGLIPARSGRTQSRQIVFFAQQVRSPLTRGRRYQGAAGCGRVGSIPAHAGETGCRSWRRRRSRVDPRSRGGDRLFFGSACRRRGRSPLTRGRLTAGALYDGLAGSIPAHAGETARGPKALGLDQVDPRSRGGDTDLWAHRDRLRGRSPLTRGRLSRRLLLGHGRRSIPAHAGETVLGVSPATVGEVDPRSRGGDP